MIRILTIVILAIGITSTDLHAQTDTTFTYQGELNQSGTPADGLFDLDFSLWADLNAGEQIGSTIMLNDVDVIEGIFTVELDFGASAFNNAGRWLEIAVNGVTLVPRQAITRSPYSIQTRGIFVSENNNVGIGTLAPTDDLHVRGDVATLKLEDDNDPSSFTLIRDTGPTQLVVSKTNSSGSVLIDVSPIPANGVDAATVRIFRGTDTAGLKSVNFLRGNNTTQLSASIGVDGKDSLFQLNGGDVGIGILEPDVKLHIEGGTDAQPTGGGYIQAGSSGGSNVVIDEDEIMARSGGLASNLHINSDGGEVVFGGSIDIGIERVQLSSVGSTAVVMCPLGKSILSGGCSGLTNEIQESFPNSDGTGWFCGFTGGNDNIAFAVCANVVWP